MSEMNDPKWIAIGRHGACFEPPNLILTRAVGSLSGPEAEATWKLVGKWTEDVTDLHWIMDISRLEHYSGAAVRAGNVHGQPILRKIHSIVCIGGSYRQRAIISLVIKAAELLRLAATAPKFAFLDSEEEARRFIDDARRGRAASHSSS